MLGSDCFSFPWLNSKVLNVKSGDPDLGSDWLTSGGVRTGGFQRLFPHNSKMESFFFFLAKWSGLGSSPGGLESENLPSNVGNVFEETKVTHARGQ